MLSFTCLNLGMLQQNPSDVEPHFTKQRMLKQSPPDVEPHLSEPGHAAAEPSCCWALPVWTGACYSSTVLLLSLTCLNPGHGAAEPFYCWALPVWTGACYSSTVLLLSLTCLNLGMVQQNPPVVEPHLSGPGHAAAEPSWCWALPVWTWACCSRTLLLLSFTCLDLGMLQQNPLDVEPHLAGPGHAVAEPSCCWASPVWTWACCSRTLLMLSLPCPLQQQHRLPLQNNFLPRFPLLRLPRQIWRSLINFLNQSLEWATFLKVQSNTIFPSICFLMHRLP